MLETYRGMFGFGFGFSHRLVAKTIAMLLSPLITCLDCLGKQYEVIGIGGKK
jgi:hypothetical protein